MASFQKDLSQTQFPYINFDFPRVDKSKAQLIESTGKVALDAVEGFAKADMVGNDADKDIVYQGEDRKSKLDKALNDPELNLRKVAAMRRQGLVSPTQAKILANQSVQAATARLPGKAAEFREEARTFFGDWGEGDGLLDENAGDKFLNKQRAKAFDDGYVTLQGEGLPPIVTNDNLTEWAKYRRRLRNNSEEQATIKLEWDRGEIRAEQGLRIATSQANTELERLTGQYRARLNGVNGVMDAQNFRMQVESARASAIAGVSTFFNNSRAPIKPADRSAAVKAINDRFKVISDFIDSGDYETIMKSNANKINYFMSVEGSRAFPLIATANSIGGQSLVNWMLEKQHTISDMPEDVRTAYFQNDPASALLWDQSQEAQRLIGGFKTMLDGQLPSYGDPNYNIVRDAAKHSLENADSNEPSGAKARESADKIIKQSVANGQISDAAVYTTPKWRNRATPQEKVGVLNMVDVNNTSATLSLGDWFAGPSATGMEVKYNPKLGRFTAGLTKEIPAIAKKFTGFEKGTPIAPNALSTQLKINLDSLNMNLAILQNLHGTPEYNSKIGQIDPLSYMESVLENIKTVGDDISQQREEYEKKKKEAESDKTTNTTLERGNVE